MCRGEGLQVKQASDSEEVMNRAPRRAQDRLYLCLTVASQIQA